MRLCSQMRLWHMNEPVRLECILLGTESSILPFDPFAREFLSLCALVSLYLPLLSLTLVLRGEP